MDEYLICTCHGCQQTWAIDFQPACDCEDDPLPESTFQTVVATDYYQSVHKVIVGTEQPK